MVIFTSGGSRGGTTDLSMGGSFRTLNILDNFNREIVNIVVDTSISFTRSSLELTQIFGWRGKPRTIRVDNDP
jgi:putative transposase